MTAPVDWPALGRRALAAGMRLDVGAVVRPILANGETETTEGVVVRFAAHDLPVVWWPDLHETRAHAPTGHLLPVLSSPATLGVLEAQVRAAWGKPLSVWYDDEITSQGSWCIDSLGRDGESDGGLWMGDHIAEAWIAALEAAKGGEHG